MQEQRKQLGIAAALTGQDRDREVRFALAESLYAKTGCGAEIVSLLADNLQVLRQHLMPDLHATALAETLSQVSLVWDRKMRHKRKSILQSAARLKSRQLEKRFLKAVADLNLSSPIAEWHSLRLQVKQLRYWGQGFAAVLTQRQNRRLPILTDLQQSLGLVHDIALFEEQWPHELTLPKRWQKRLKKQQQHALEDAADVLQQLKRVW